MYNVSNEFLTEVKKPSRTIDSKIDIGVVTIDTSLIIDFTMDSSFGTNDMPTLGGVVSSGLSITLLDDVSLPSVLTDTPIVPYVAIDVDGLGTFEWVKLGEFYAQQGDVTKTKKTITIDCLDAMSQYDTILYNTAISYPATIQSMINELELDYGLIFTTQTLPSVSFATQPKGTVRQVLGMIASLCTTNAVINSEGEVEFKFLSTSGFAFDSDNYVDFKLTSDNSIKISQLTIPTDEGATEIVAGDGTGFALKFENSAIQSSADLQIVFNRQFPLEYYAYTMKAQGMPHLQVGDYVQFTDVDLNVRTLAILNHKLSYNGGLTSEFKVNAPKEDTTDIILTGGSTLAKAISKSYTDLNQAIASATALITGSEGGYLTTLFDDISGLPSELVISDNEDLDLALNVWRWNKNGFGYSSTGFNGTYALAMTSDGQIVANFITAGTMSAERIKTGLLQSVNGETGINMTDGTFNFGNGGMVYDGTNLTFGPNVALSWSSIPGLTEMMTYIDANGIYTGTVAINKLTSLGCDPIIKLFTDLVITNGGDPAIDATENMNVGIGSQIRLKWNNNNYISVGENVIGFYFYYADVLGTSAVCQVRPDGFYVGGVKIGGVSSEGVYIPGSNEGETTIWVQPDAPSSAKMDDVWIDTDDYSRYDELAIGVNTTLLISDKEVILASGTISITLHGATSPGVVKKIYNVGTGIVTLIGSINGEVNMYLYPNESVDLITDGTEWRY